VYVDVPQQADPQMENKRFVTYKLIQEKKCRRATSVILKKYCTILDIMSWKTKARSKHSKYAQPTA
jgi:hypothetical protein